MRLVNYNVIQGEDRNLVRIDGWENLKMKKKRLCIKIKFYFNLALSKMVDG